MRMPVVAPCTELWSTKLTEGFCTMALATLFRPKELSLIVGCEDGLVRIYDVSAKCLNLNSQTVLETKSGPIQCLRVHDITKFYHNDLIILSRQSLSSDSIICVTVVEDNGGSPIIVCSNDSGVITWVQPTKELWRINLNSLSNKNPSHIVKVSCLQTVQITDSTGNRRQYLLAADNSNRIHVICNGTVVSSLMTPSVITAMTQGRFVPSSKLSLPPGTSSSASDSEQVALGASNGAVYILHNFHVTLDEFVHAKCTVTNLCTLPQSDSSTDLLLCAGYFSALHLYKDGQLIMEYPTSDWVTSIAKADIDGDGTLEVVIGCKDNTVVALKL
ncbi:unnamed protein product [Candidula unifasciata]|uniref:Uncharacterized protein n=1 Tax=Candidula unifasciata TaxID=100452 RepID=A0A8S3Z0M3_9EUPU|nr:unnamed protein product [Candidula unifasciata]